MRGLAAFCEHFARWQDRYVLIGGVATDVLLEDAGLMARATKDLDVVLLVESLDAEFGRAFWDFILAGEYECRHRSTGKRRFYRFDKPSSRSFPAQIELFSRQPDVLVLPKDAELTPLPLAEELSSLSAILLDDTYYAFVRQGVLHFDGLSVLGPEHLIPMKARAWLDLTDRRASGATVDSHDINKHRTDVVRLSQLVAPTTRVELSASIADDMADSLARAFDDGLELRQLGIRATTAEVVTALRAVYAVGT